MRQFLLPALLCVALSGISSSDASAFGLLDKLCGKSSCDACDMGPTCGCEVAPACEPACGCEIVEPCCDSGCAKPRGLFAKLFGKKHGCDTMCEPACGCEPIAPVCEPTCGCEVIAPICEPACGCEIAPACEPACGFEPACGCEVPACKPSCGTKIKGFFKKLFNHKRSCCDSCDAQVYEPACGCETPGMAYPGYAMPAATTAAPCNCGH